MSEACNGAGIYAEGVVKTFDKGRIRALQGATVEVCAGEFVALMGPSGCGKSTLLHILGALERPDAGRVVVAGEDVLTLADADRFRAEQIGFVFQLHNLIPTLTTFENVLVPMLGAVTPREDPARRAKQVIEAVGLADRFDALPATLSGGERQRVAVARAFVNRPRVILADEPTGSLDSAAGDQILDLLEAMRHEEGTTLLVVTHDPRVSARTDRVVSMLDGQIEAASR